MTKPTPTKEPWLNGIEAVFPSINMTLEGKSIANIASAPGNWLSGVTSTWVETSAPLELE